MSSLEEDAALGFVFDIPVQTVANAIPAVVVLVLNYRQNFTGDPVCFVRVEPGLFRRFFAARVDDDFLESAQARYAVLNAALPFLCG